MGESYGGTIIVPFWGGNININRGVNLNGWNSSAYIQVQFIATGAAGGGYAGVGKGGFLGYGPSTPAGFSTSSSPYIEADAGLRYAGRIGATLDPKGNPKQITLLVGGGAGIGVMEGQAHTITLTTPTPRDIGNFVSNIWH